MKKNGGGVLKVRTVATVFHASIWFKSILKYKVTLQFKSSALLILPVYKSFLHEKITIATAAWSLSTDQKIYYHNLSR